MAAVAANQKLNNTDTRTEQRLMTDPTETCNSKLNPSLLWSCELQA